jgi:hypothetical protein
MNIEAALDTYLRADTTLMAYLGGAGAPTLTTGRLYWMQAPEGATLPYVVYTMVSDTDAIEFFGTQNAGQGRVQISAVSTSKTGKAIADRIRTLLRYSKGTIGGLTTWTIEPVNRYDSFNADTSRYVFGSDYIWHAEY